MNATSTKNIIFVALLNEGTPVWRPVVATNVGSFTYCIEGNAPPDETWQFLPGQLVKCEHKTFAGGESGLVAVREAATHGNLLDRSLSAVLQSTSDSLFPESLGKQAVDIDSTDVDGDTPLHVLLWRNDTAGALLLIEHGANVNAVGDMGETPLHVAIRQENMEVVKAMLAAGARTDIVSEFGQTPLALAEEKGIKLG